MESLTLEQLRVANAAGGIAGVKLKGQGGTFLIEIATRSGPSALLAKARSTEPRRFGSPAAALHVLRDIGITTGEFDAKDWNPDEKANTAGNRGRGRSEALRKAYDAVSWNALVAAEIQEAIDDPGPSVPHEEVMARMDARVARHKAGRGRRA